MKRRCTVRKWSGITLLCMIVSTLGSVNCGAQETPTQGESSSQGASAEGQKSRKRPTLLQEQNESGATGLVNRFVDDQRSVWTSPARLRFSDTEWLVPAAGFAAGLFVTDRDVSQHLSHDSNTIGHYSTLSNAGLGALIGGAGGLWLLGRVRHNDHWSETGFLAGEAVVNSLVMVEGLKSPLGRETP